MAAQGIRLTSLSNTAAECLLQALRIVVENEPPKPAMSVGRLFGKQRKQNEALCLEDWPEPVPGATGLRVEISPILILYIRSRQ